MKQETYVLLISSHQIVTALLADSLKTVGYQPLIVESMDSAEMVLNSLKWPKPSAIVCDSGVFLKHQKKICSLEKDLLPEASIICGDSETKVPSPWIFLPMEIERIIRKLNSMLSCRKKLTDSV